MSIRSRRLMIPAAVKRNDASDVLCGKRVCGNRHRVTDSCGNAGGRRTTDWSGGDQVLGGTRGEAAYYLIVTPTQAGPDVALIGNNGR